jgi:hypothetical protein
MSVECVKKRDSMKKATGADVARIAMFESLSALLRQVFERSQL